MAKKRSLPKASRNESAAAERRADPPQNEIVPLSGASFTANENSAIRQLEEERAALRAAVEQGEGSQRELKSAYAETLSLNEELRTANKQLAARITELEAGRESLEQEVAERVQTLEILEDIAVAANQAVTVEEAIRSALRRICDYNHWITGHVYRVQDDDHDRMESARIWYINEKHTDPRRLNQLREFHRLNQKVSFPRGEGLVGKVWESGEACWIDDVTRSGEWVRQDPKRNHLAAAIVFPIKIGDDVVAVFECLSDQVMQREDCFTEIMENVGIQLGLVIRRNRLEKELVAAAEREQRRIGSDIHDGLGQELTGLRYIAQSHADALAGQHSPEEKTARRLADGLQAVQQQLRAIVRDLVPLEVGQAGLVSALNALAAQTTEIHRIPCELKCGMARAIHESSLATQLYRIAQEAVNNAVKHARCRQITIRLDEHEDFLTLQVIDDGMGIQHRESRGIGLRTMAYRAALIGGTLTIDENAPGGTIVTCLVPPRHLDAQSTGHHDS